MATTAAAVAALALSACGAGSGGGATARTDAQPTHPGATSPSPSAPSPRRAESDCGPFPPRHAWAQELSRDGRLLWRTKLHIGEGAGEESLAPIVVDNEVLTAQDGAIQALDRSDGHVLWSWQGGESVYGMWLSGNSLAILTDQVGHSAALTGVSISDGRVLWHDAIAAGGLYGDIYRTADDSLAWLRADGLLQVVQLSDGRVAWSHHAGRAALETIGELVIYAGGGLVTAYDDRTGRVAWRVTGAAPDPQLTTAAGLVLVNSAEEGPGIPSAVTAIDPQIGRVRWRFDVGSYLDIKGGNSQGVLMATYVPDRRVYLVGADSGKVTWQRDTAFAVDTYPLVLADTVVAVEGGVAGYLQVRLVARALSSGDPLWRASMPGEVGATEPLKQFGGLVILQQASTNQQRDTVAAFDLRTGRASWTRSVPTSVNAPATVSGSDLVVQAADGAYACAV